VDGVALDALQVGQTYDLPSSLAMYLVVTERAEIVDEPAKPLPERVARREFQGDWPGWAVAADWLRLKRDDET
jgi:hypothetical protein